MYRGKAQIDLRGENKNMSNKKPNIGLFGAFMLLFVLTHSLEATTFSNFDPISIPASGTEGIADPYQSIINVSGMTGSTTYHYCAIGVNASGTGLGSVISFTTRALIPPTVTTGSSSDICSNSAYTSGSANPKGSYTNVWFRYSADPSFVCNDMSGTKTSSSDVGFGDTNTSFKTQISGLSSNTNYYYCAIAQNEGGQKAIGGTMTFKTNTKSCGGGGGRGEQQNNFDAAPPTSTPFSTGGGGTL